MQGKVQLLPVHHDQVGITPACAGKSGAMVTKTQAGRDHPRVCGEKGCSSTITSRKRGSPPRVRGKDSCSSKQRRRPGITPAYAGKSAAFRDFSTGTRDHPRVCGEKCPPGKFFFMTVGSPPRVRGKGLLQYDNIQKERITPARAGKRLLQFKAASKTRDHPRVCGEKCGFQGFQHGDKGSPPRVRGKVSAGKILLHDGGITPACAGKRAAADFRL